MKETFSVLLKEIESLRQQVSSNRSTLSNLASKKKRKESELAAVKLT